MPGKEGEVDEFFPVDWKAISTLTGRREKTGVE